MSSGTDEAVGTPVSDPLAADLYRTIDIHAQVEGRCPICRTRFRCWEWARARAALILSGRPPTRPA